MSEKLLCNTGNYRECLHSMDGNFTAFEWEFPVALKPYWLILQTNLLNKIRRLSIAAYPKADDIELMLGTSYDTSIVKHTSDLLMKHLRHQLNRFYLIICDVILNINQKLHKKA